MYARHEPGVVFDMFHDVKQPDRGKRIGDDSGIVERSPDDPLYPPAERVSHSRQARFHENYLASTFLNGPGDATVPAPDIEEGSSRRKLPHCFEDAVIAVFEPEGRVFHEEAELIALIGIRNRR
jgi:hypothetical protein